jgi:phosphoglycolate phosphatase-like HAD superfamily hydrolase
MLVRALKIAVVVALPFVGIISAQADPLPSWNGTDTKAAIIEFVEATTTLGDDNYIDPAERIATFDNDGTLWAEQPFYFQIAYAIDKVKEMAAADPSIVDKSPALKAAAEGDLEGILAGGHDGLLEVIATSHSGMTTHEFKESVAAWLDTARHPKTGQRSDDMIYQPMLELLGYLRENGYKTYIVSGGGIDFIRVFSEEAYGIPPEQVVGSSIKAEFKVSDAAADTVKLPELFFYDDKEGKPVAINHHIGRRPVIASGNSDGDLQMLQYATRGDEPGLAILLHHTDTDREWAYDRDSKIGHLDKALDEASQRDWVVVDMKEDWRVVFPWELN